MRRGRFCVVCGRVTEDLIESRCRECFVKEKKLVILPERIEVKLCRQCLSYFRKGKWTSIGKGLSEVVEKAALDAVSDALKIKELTQSKTEINVEDIKESSRKLYIVSCTVELSGKISGSDYSSRHEARVLARFELCDECSRKSGGYYESILQIRGEVSRTRRELLQSKIASMLSTFAEKDRRAFVTDFQEKKEGLDFYLGSTKAARKIARELQKELGGVITESPKLFGVSKSGEDLYRTSIALRLVKFSRGEVITFRGHELEVLGFSKDRLVALDLQSKKRVLLYPKSLKEAKVMKRKEDIQKS